MHDDNVAMLTNDKEGRTYIQTEALKPNKEVTLPTVSVYSWQTNSATVQSRPPWVTTTLWVGRTISKAC